MDATECAVRELPSFMDIPPPHVAELELRRSFLIARVRPDIGGSISGFWSSATGTAGPVLRPAVAEASGPLQMASFPLVPFCNRIEEGRFTWEGRNVRLAPNDPNDEFPLHGYGWKARWIVVSRSVKQIELHWHHSAGEWPWAFDAHQSIGLTGDSLRVELSVTNRSSSVMPAGLGHHPYFPLGSDTRFSAHVDCKCETDARLIPTHLTPVAGQRIFGERGAPHGHSLDNTFIGWRGPALIEQPGAKLRIEITAEPRHQALAVFVPPSHKFFCVEPVTHVPNAFNDPQAAVALRALAPGERMQSTMDIKCGKCSS